MGAYLGLLGRDGTLVELGAPEQPLSVPFFPLGGLRRSLAGSMIGGIAETQEMLDFCAEHDVTRSEEHTSELQSLMRISYAVFCLKKKKLVKNTNKNSIH